MTGSGPVRKVLDKLKAVGSVVDAFELTPDVCREAFDEEGTVGCSSGFPLENEALAVSEKLRHHVLVVYGDMFDEVHDSSVEMRDGSGRRVGWIAEDKDIPELSKRGDLIVMSGNFVVTEDFAELKDVHMVLPVQHLGVIGEAEGVKGQIAMFPSPSTDDLLRTRFRIPKDSALATAIVSFDEL